MIFLFYVLPAILVIIFLCVAWSIDRPTQLDIGDVGFALASVFVPVFNVIMVGVVAYVVWDKYKSKVIWTRK